jgi:hypothetical protein
VFFLKEKIPGTKFSKNAFVHLLPLRKDRSAFFRPDGGIGRHAGLKLI